MNGSDSRDQDLSDRRINAVRDALIKAGLSTEMTDTLGRNEHTCTLAGNAEVILDGKVRKAADQDRLN